MNDANTTNELLDAFQALHMKCRYNYVANTPQIVGNAKKAIIERNLGIRRLASVMVLMTEAMEITQETQILASHCLDAWWREQYVSAMKAVCTPH